MTMDLTSHSDPVSVFSDEIFNDQLRPKFELSYLWDSCQRGLIFEPEIYNSNKLTQWIDKALRKSFEEIPFPAHLDKEKIFIKARQLIREKLLRKNIFKDFESIDPENLESIRDYIKENKGKQERSFDEFLNIFRTEDFPPIIWMELKRLNKIIVESVEFMLDRISNWYKLYPKRKSMHLSRTRQVREMSQSCQEIFNSFLNTMLRFSNLLFFIELYSCKNEEDLFKKKELTLKTLDNTIFERIFFPLHDAVNDLTASFYKASGKSVDIAFSDPTGWALKQLILRA